MKKFVDAAILSLTILVLVLFLGRLSSAALVTNPSPPPAGDRHAAHREPVRSNRDIARVVTILESRIGQNMLPKEARIKLASMNDEDYRLVTSLCDRIAGTGNSHGADVALMLVTTVIILS